MAQRSAPENMICQVEFDKKSLDKAMTKKT